MPYLIAAYVVMKDYSKIFSLYFYDSFLVVLLVFNRGSSGEDKDSSSLGSASASRSAKRCKLTADFTKINRRRGQIINFIRFL